MSDFLADEIEAQSEALVEEWISWLTEHVSLRPARMLPREAIRDHIPKVVRGIAESLRSPVETVALAVDDSLRSHARMRHDQGYDIEELLKEYQVLDEIVSERMMKALERYPGQADPLDVGRVFLRLSSGLGTMTDITVRVYRKTEVRHKRQLHQQLEDYVRTITHELKQPLNVVTAGTGMLEDEGVASEAEQRKRYIEIIRRGIDRAVGLIDDIRTLALVEGAEQKEEWQPLETSVALVLDQMEELAEKKDVHLDVARPLPKIHVDTTRVEIALVNLISNSIKYSDPEKPKRWARIEVERVEPEEAHRWEIRVVDNGLGIPETVQPQIFERHFRAHPDVEQGTGLGLAISRQVIEQAGGKIRFESTPGGGSTFYVTVAGQLEEDQAPPEAR